VILDKEVDNTFLHLPLNINIISQQKTVNLQSDGNSYLEFHVPFSTFYSYKEEGLLHGQGITTFI